MKDKNGHHLTRKHYELLKELGIEVVMYEYKVYDDNPDKVCYGFQIFGGLKEEVDFDELLTYLQLLKASKESKIPEVRELYEQILTLMVLTEENNG